MQEVRGVETQRVIYHGESYRYRDGNDFRAMPKESDEYYGFEFTNKNKISVSVSIEVYERGSIEDKICTTKEVILNSGESYILKQPLLYKYVESHVWPNSGEKNGRENADRFYVKYKAYKLL